MSSWAINAFIPRRVAGWALQSTDDATEGRSLCELAEILALLEKVVQ